MKNKAQRISDQARLICYVCVGGVDMNVRYEMQIRTKSDPKKKWRHFDDRKTIDELDCYEMYKKHPLYDAKIIKITTSKEMVKET